MKNHNIYKDIVWLAVLLFFISKGVGWGKDYAKERKDYGLQIQADQDLTAYMIGEFQKLSGICGFRPTDTAAVTIEFEGYSLQTELTGVDLEEYPLKWERLSGLQESGRLEAGGVQTAVFMGRTPAFFFGSETFYAFTDKRGRPPLKSQVEMWMERYETLEMTVTDEGGRKRKTKICGILAQPEDKICMDIAQMKETFGRFSHTSGGFMKISGYKNMKKARVILESAGFMIQDFVL